MKRFTTKFENLSPDELIKLDRAFDISWGNLYNHYAGIKEVGYGFCEKCKVNHKEEYDKQKEWVVKRLYELREMLR